MWYLFSLTLLSIVQALDDRTIGDTLTVVILVFMYGFGFCYFLCKVIQTLLKKKYHRMESNPGDPVDVSIIISTINDKIELSNGTNRSSEAEQEVSAV